MSTTEQDLNSLAYLKWRKLQLSRAKLKESSKASALLSGFAMVAMVEMELNHNCSSKEHSKIPQELYIVFAVNTTLLVAIHILALMISTCILPNMDAICNLSNTKLVEEFPQSRLHWYIETAWIFTTVVGLLLFLCEIAIICWIKFIDISEKAAWAVSIVLVPVFIIFFVFAAHFYRSLFAHKYKITVTGLKEVEMLQEQIDACNIEGRIHLLPESIT